MYDYDVIVLGGGSAGGSAAAAAAGAGARTLMINDGELGGLCILRGCMPTKALLESAHALHHAGRLEPLGVRLDGRVVADFARIMSRKASQVERFQRAKIRSVEAQEYEVRFGRARFAGDGKVRVDGTALRARSFVIATGSVPTMLPIPGLDRVPVLTSDDVMRLATRPESIVVQGAGPTGLELAQFFARIGTRVLLVNRSPLLSRLDPECGEELRRAFAEEPRLRLAVPGRIERLAKRGSGLTASVGVGETVEEHEADALLMATGRHAALEDLGLEEVGLAPAGDGLAHDSRMRTANPRVFVAGDATGRFQRLHLANQEGAVAGFNAAGGTPERRMSYRLKATVIFTDPPFAHAGATEHEARRDRGGIVVGRARFPETGRAITMETRHGLWKLIAERRSGEILGSAILGPRADDLIHLVTTLMGFDARVEQIFDLPWYHPTLSEVMLNIGRDAVRQMDSGERPHEPPPPGYEDPPGEPRRSP